DYDLQLTVRDTLGLSGIITTRIIVDNVPPYADVTSPATVLPESGGNVYTADGSVHLYFPPHAFAEGSAVVRIDERASTTSALANDAPAVLESRIYGVTWGSASLRKSAILTMRYGPSASPGASAQIWRAVGATWHPAGGTVTAGDSSVVI